MILKVLLLISIFNSKFCESKILCQSNKEWFEINSNTNQIEYSCNDKPEDVNELVANKFSLDQFPNEIFDRFPNLNRVVIKLKRKNIDVLSNNFFARRTYGGVMELEFKSIYGYNPKRIQTLEIDVLKKFQNLQKLSIRRFNFATFEKIKFGNQLKKLWLNRNGIKKLRNNQLKDLVNLNEVNFNSNPIKKIPKNFFKGLHKLEEVRFESNLLEFLPSLFKDNQKLKRVFFSNNKIQKIDPEIFSGLVLEVQSFDGNPCASDSFKSQRDLTNCYIGWPQSESVSSTEDTEIERTESVMDSMQSLDCDAPSISSRVFFGETVELGKYPWKAAFFVDNEYTCGGNLISPNHILFAAHCIRDKFQVHTIDPKNCYFLLGKSDLTTDESGSLKVDISKFIMHPDWDINKIDRKADIALAVLATKVEFSETIGPICLNRKPIPDFYNRVGRVCAWGATEHNHTISSDVALEIEVVIPEIEDCLKKDSDLAYIISETSFCGGFRNGTGVCRGDSGSSLFLIDNDETYRAVGIVSASLIKPHGVCDTYHNQIYTEIAPYYSWIAGHVEN